MKFFPVFAVKLGHFIINNYFSICKNHDLGSTTKIGNTKKKVYRIGYYRSKNYTLFIVLFQDFDDIQLNEMFPNLTELHLSCNERDENLDQAILNSELKNHVTHYFGKFDHFDPLTWISNFPKTKMVSLEILRTIESNKR